MKKLFLAGALALAISAQAENAPLWLRNTAISPDGSRIAFTYKGDIYVVPVSGGMARQLTTSSAYDTRPLWSPDGKKIAFNSDREGSMDIFVIPAEGGTPRRITTHSGREDLRAWAGNDTLMFSTSLLPAVDAAQGSFTAQIYKVGVENPRRPEMVMSWPATAISMNPDGRMLFQDKKGYEDVLRKHEHSSGTADIWLNDNGRFTKLTQTNVQNQNPVWAPDGKTFFYVTENENGTMNVHSRTLDGTDKALTNFDKHPVRSLSVAGNGTMAFSWNGEIYTVTPGAQPKKVNVDIVADIYRPSIHKSTQIYNARSIAVSPDGSEIAFINGGDVYVTSVKYKTTKRITNTPEQERTVDFAPDGRSLVYDSERGGLWQLYTATIADKKEKNFTYATDIEEKLLYSSPDSLPAFQPAYSPDGKKIAFLEDRTALRVIDADGGKKATTALDGKYNYSYTDGDVSFEWSPDSRWLLADYIGIGGWNNSDIALVKADGSEVVDLTESGYSDGGARWALGGKAVLWSTDRNGYRSHGSWGSQRDVYAIFLDPEAYDRFLMSEEDAALADEAKKGKKDDKKDDEKKDDDKDKKKKVEPLEFDLPNAKYRMVRLTPGAGSYADYMLNNDGTKFYYLAGGDLWEKDIRNGNTKVLTRGAGYSSLVPDSKGENVFLGGWQIAKVNLANGAKETVEFAAEREYSPAAEREYMFDHMHNQVQNKFYDPTLHGVDWDFYGDEYRRFLPHIDNGYDFAEMLSEILGELNASHTGGRYYAPNYVRPTAELGAFYDPAYTGKGLKVAEVINRGPLSAKSANVKPGDMILAIDGTEIEPGADYFPLLEGKSGKRVRLTVKRKGGKTEDVTVKPVSSVSSLLYERWVERNQAIVDSVSGGRVAYVHVQGMNSPSFREVFSQLLGKYRNHEAVVVDTRWNGGGWLHNDIAQLLSGREYVRFNPRGRYIGSEPFTQWTKPSAMLVNEGNYSDAHGTPFVYKTLGIGKLVGAPVPGTMTAVWWETQVNPTIVFGIPQVTTMDMQGNVLENTQLNPDITVYNDPAEVLRGHDAQLIEAVKSLMNKE